MNKQELIDAIEATLVTNGNKAITADALRNLLIDIVENSGGGGGITLQLSIEIDETGNTVPAVTPEQIAHNKEQMDILKQLHDEGKPIPPIALEMISTTEGTIEGTQLVMYMVSIMWDITGEVPEEFPEGLIFPFVSVLDAIHINGDGTLIEM